MRLHGWFWLYSVGIAVFCRGVTARTPPLRTFQRSYCTQVAALTYSNANVVPDIKSKWVHGGGGAVTPCLLSAWHDGGTSLHPARGNGVQHGLT